MINWITNDIISFLISVVVAGLIIPQILIIAYRKKLFDEIDPRKVHEGTVPRLGGIAFFPSILFSIALVAGINMKLSEGGCLQWFEMSLSPMYLMICAVILMFLVGMADDLVGVKYRAKFVVQILASVLVIMSGMVIDNFHGLLWLHELPTAVGWIFTSFAIVYVVNSINLIDGIDGLASGLSTVALVFYAVIFYFSGEYVYSMLASASAGTLLPFFYYNVFGNPAKQKKIFMGDAGALTTGMILAFCSIAVLHLDVPDFSVTFNPVVIAVSPLIIPCFDVVRVSLHRMIRHRNPFLPDKCHIHHKLLALGMHQRGALCLIMVFSMLFILFNVLVSPYVNPTLIVAFDVVIYSVANILLTRAIKQREISIGQLLYQ